MLDVSNPITRPLFYCTENAAVFLDYRLLQRHISKLSPISDLISEVCKFQLGTKLCSNCIILPGSVSNLCPICCWKSLLVFLLNVLKYRLQWPRDLKRGSEAARFLGLRVRILRDVSRI